MSKEKNESKVIKLASFKVRPIKEDSPINTRFVITPQNMQDMEDAKDEYQLIPSESLKNFKHLTGLYDWVQVKHPTVANGRTFSEKMIIARLKNENPSSHAFLLTDLLGFKKDDIIRAGTLVIDKEGRIACWDLRTGTYHSGFPENAQCDVGLSLKKFRPVNPGSKSPDITEMLRAEFMLFSQKKPQKTSKPLPQEALLNVGTSSIVESSSSTELLLNLTLDSPSRLETPSSISTPSSMGTPTSVSSEPSPFSETRGFSPRF
ncbi:MAG: hypothetical protein QM752_08340 [Gammaproteobacteria bacterium]